MRHQARQTIIRRAATLITLAALAAFTTPTPAQVITHELLRSAQPAPNISRIAFSQDETCALYTRDDAIYFTKLDGVSPPVMLYTAEDVTSKTRELFISPDASRAVFQLTDGYKQECHVISLSGGVEDSLITGFSFKATPDQNWLVWNYRTDDDVIQFWSLRLTGFSEPVLLFEMSTNRDLRITNTHATFKDGDKIFVVPLDGSSSPIFVRDTRGYPNTDNRYLYFSEYNSIAKRYFTYAVFPPVPSVLIALDPEPLPQVYDGANYIPASSSPDGRFIASRVGNTLSVVPTGNEFNTDDSELIRQSIVPTSRPIWSPDSRFACLFLDSSVLLIDTKNPTQVVDLQNNSSVKSAKFSIDSSKLVYRSFTNRAYIVDLLKGHNVTVFQFEGNTQGPYLDSGSKVALISSPAGLFSIGLESLQLQKIGDPLLTFAQDGVFTSTQPESLLLPAILQGHGSAPCRLSTQTGQLTALTPLPDRIPSDLGLLGVAPVDETLYLQTQYSKTSPEGVLAYSQGAPSNLEEVFPETIPVPERMFRFAGADGAAFFMTADLPSIFTSRAGNPATVAFEPEPLIDLTNFLLTMPAAGEFALITRESREWGCTECCNMDANGQCEDCCGESIYYRQIVVLPGAEGVSDYLNGDRVVAIRHAFEPKRQQILTVYEHYEHNWYENRILLSRLDNPSLGWSGNLLGISSPLDCAISETVRAGENTCQEWPCTPIEISRIDMGASFERRRIQREPFHTFDALAPTQYSEPAERLLLQPTDHTLQTLSVAPGAAPVIVDDLVDATRDGLLISPDGLYAAYVRTANDSGIPTVCVAELRADTPARELSLWTPGNTFDAVDRLAFSPASNAVLFIATEPGGNTCLYTAPPDGALPAIRRTPTWLHVDRYIVSPDSAWIAYAARDANTPDDGILTWYSVPLFGGYNAPLINTDDTLEGDPVWAGGNLYWIAKEETARVLYAAEPSPAPPAFTTQPKPRGPLRIGGSAHFTVQLAPPGNATLQWEFAPTLPGGTPGRYTPLTNGNGIRGATTKTLRLNITRPGPQFTGRYRCTATNPAGIAFTRPLQLEIQ